MALEIIGNVLTTGTPTNIQTRDGRTFTRRTLILVQRRFNPDTGEEFAPNYPGIEFNDRDCDLLDRWKQGDRVKVSFRVVGAQFQDRQTGETKYFNTLRGWKVEAAPLPQQPQYAPQQPQQAYAPPQQPQYAQQPQQPLPPQPPLQQYAPQQPLPQQPPRPAALAQQGDGLPF